MANRVGCDYHYHCKFCCSTIISCISTFTVVVAAADIVITFVVDDVNKIINILICYDYHHYYINITITIIIIKLIIIIIIIIIII